MRKINFLKLIIFLTSSIIPNIRAKKVDLTFPDDFSFGTASSAYQVEGAWNHSDKSASVWDSFTHKYPEKMNNGSNGDIACDSFNKYKEDVQLLRNLKINHYRFSLSWPRLLPTGYTDKVSKNGVQYYNDLLTELEKYNITPVVTIYHWDHPQSLEKFGGWLNESMAYVFADYARFVFETFGHRIKHFVTINEIAVMCMLGYRIGAHPPGMISTDTKDYVCVHNALKAHALAYRIYDKEFRKKQNGVVGLAELVPSFYNKDKNDTSAKDIGHAFIVGWIYHPIYKGNYPEIMINRIAERSRLQGYNTSRLPTFSNKWINYIRGTTDFLGFNHYNSAMVKQSSEKNPLFWRDDSGLEISLDPAWVPTEMPGNTIFPKGFGDVLRKLKEEYNNPPIYVLENGIALSSGFNDTVREEYLYLYLREMLMAMKRDKCDVKMYTYWSLLDSFEWSNGYSKHFGLVQIDHTSKNRTRTMKKSASWLRSVLTSRKLKVPTLFNKT